MSLRVGPITRLWRALRGVGEAGHGLGGPSCWRRLAGARDALGLLEAGGVPPSLGSILTADGRFAIHSVAQLAERVGTRQPLAQRVGGGAEITAVVAPQWVLPFGPTSILYRVEEGGGAIGELRLYRSYLSRGFLYELAELVAEEVEGLDAAMVKWVALAVARGRHRFRVELDPKQAQDRRVLEILRSEEVFADDAEVELVTGRRSDRARFTMSSIFWEHHLGGQSHPYRRITIEGPTRPPHR